MSKNVRVPIKAGQILSFNPRLILVAVDVVEIQSGDPALSIHAWLCRLIRSTHDGGNRTADRHENKCRRGRVSSSAVERECTSNSIDCCCNCRCGLIVVMPQKQVGRVVSGRNRSVVVRRMMLSFLRTDCWCDCRCKVIVMMQETSAD